MVTYKLSLGEEKENKVFLFLASIDFKFSFKCNIQNNLLGAVVTECVLWNEHSDLIHKVNIRLFHFYLSFHLYKITRSYNPFINLKK